jgi:adenylyltransferase/sulfurtransferase
MSVTRVQIDEADRYARLKLIGWWDQQRLREARILVVGAGALGNEVLKNLALVGVGRIVLVDFDTVENSNLSRSVLFRAAHAGQAKATVAAAAIQELNPDVTVQAISGNVLTDIGLGLVRNMDLVIGCLDNREARLWVNRMCWKVNTPWIDGGIQEINGVARVFMPPDGACYECGMTERDYQLIQLRYSCPLLKREDLQQGKVPTAPTIASMIGALQVQEALKLLHGLPADYGSALVFNGVANQFYKSAIQRREDCLSHETWEPVLESSLTHSSCLQDASRWLEQAGHGPLETLILDRDFVTSLDCGNCGETRDVNLPLPLVSPDLAICPTCQEPVAPRMLHVIDIAGPLAGEPLAAIGVPDQDILRVTAGGQSRFVQLKPRPPVDPAPGSRPARGTSGCVAED